MKKILFLSAIAVLALSIACNKDKERTEQTFNVEIYRMEDSVEVAPEGSAVWLLDGSFEIDWNSSATSFQNGAMLLENGERFTFIQQIIGPTHKHTFENVKNGEYWIVITCPVKSGTIDDGDYPRGYRKITVDKNTHGTTLKFVFTDDDRGESFYHYNSFKEK